MSSVSFLLVHRAKRPRHANDPAAALVSRVFQRLHARALPLLLWNLKKKTARSLAFARHLIYSLNKYNIKVVMCYNIQYSQYVE